MTRKVILKRKNAESILQALHKNGEYEVIAITDKREGLSIPEGYNGPLISTFDAAKLYHSEKADEILITEDMRMQTLQDIVGELHAWGVDEKDVRIVRREFLKEPVAENLIHWEKYSRIPYLEFHVADHCNLNCKGCVHFSPLVRESVFPKLSDVERDFIRLREIIEYIDTIRILGGEPLLNPELSRYVEMVHEIYPKSHISIVSNGLLLRQMKEDLFNAMLHTGTSLDISLYPPMIDKIYNEVYRVREKGIQVSVSAPIREFSVALDENSGHAAYARRNNCNCPNLYNGKLYVCPIIAYAKYFNAYFGEELDENDGGINIYDETLTFLKIKTELRKVRKMCDRCLYISKEQERLQKWERTTVPRKADYMLEAD